MSSLHGHISFWMFLEVQPVHLSMSSLSQIKNWTTSCTRNMVACHPTIFGIIMRVGQAAVIARYFFHYRIPRIQTWIYQFSMLKRELGALGWSIQLIRQILRRICLYPFRVAIEIAIRKVCVIPQLMKVVWHSTGELHFSIIWMFSYFFCHVFFSTWWHKVNLIGGAIIFFLIFQLLHMWSWSWWVWLQRWASFP